MFFLKNKRKSKDFLACAASRALVFPAAIFFFNLFAQPIFEFWAPYDIFLHFLGGVSIAIGGAIFISALITQKKLPAFPNWFMFVTLLNLTLFVGVLWEFWEFGLDSVFGSIHQGSLKDTMGDFLMDFAGGTVGALISVKRKHFV